MECVSSLKLRCRGRLGQVRYPRVRLGGGPWYWRPVYLCPARAEREVWTTSNAADVQGTLLVRRRPSASGVDEARHDHGRARSPLRREGGALINAAGLGEKFMFDLGVFVFNS